MDIEEKFLKKFVKVTQQASIATLSKIGKKDKNEIVNYVIIREKL